MKISFLNVKMFSSHAFRRAMAFLPRRFLHIKETKICLGLTILEDGCCGFINHFGKFDRMAVHGLNVTVPLIETMNIINMKELSIKTGTHRELTKDRVEFFLSGVIFFRVTDPQKVCYEVGNLRSLIIERTNVVVKESVNEMNSDDLFNNL